MKLRTFTEKIYGIQNVNIMLGKGVCSSLFIVFVLLSLQLSFGQQHISWMFEPPIFNYTDSQTLFIQRTIDAALNWLKGVRFILVSILFVCSLKKTGPSRHPGGISQKFRVSFLLCSQLTTLFTSVIVFLKVIGFCIFITKSSLEFSDPIISSDSPSQYFSTSLSHLKLFCRTFLYRICLQFKTSSASQKIRGTPIEKCKGVPGRCNKLFGVIKGEVLGNNTGCVIKLLPVSESESEVQKSCILYQLYHKYQYPTALCVIVKNSW